MGKSQDSAKQNSSIEQNKEEIEVKVSLLKRKLSTKNLLFLGFIFVVCISLGFLLIVKLKTKQESVPIALPVVTITPTPYVYKPPPAVCPNDDLRLLREDVCALDYFDVGTITDGKYKGYKRMLIGESGQTAYFQLVATLDNKTFVLNGNPDLKYKAGEYNDPLNQFNRSKFMGIADLSENFPEKIQVNDKFFLQKQSIYYSYKYSSDYESIVSVSIDYSSLEPVPVTGSDLKFYAEKYQPLQGDSNEAVKNLYLDHITKFIAVDQGGLAYEYKLVTSLSLQKYEAQKAKVKPGDYVDVPSVGFVATDVKTDQPIYTNYSMAFPAGCGDNSNAYSLKNVSDDMFTKIGTLSNGIDLYKIAANNQLLALEYNIKVADLKDSWQYGNGDTKKPTYDEYVAKIPLLFFKDPWGNWINQGEFDYKLPGGCGKPVIYLYPQKPTKVSVKFLTAIKFDVDIPTYTNSWSVLANPDGNLKDLNSQATDCRKIDSSRVGSEYAKRACSTGIYPYLYWAGRSLEREYPVMTEGWIVSKDQLSFFLNSKLDEIGLTKKEKGDMLEYWLPQLQSKNAPYYRISFLQNKEMNDLVPMDVTPAPDSVLRVFLDYQTFNNKPNINLKPQVLNKFNRSGFTMVEWGGLEK